MAERRWSRAPKLSLYSGEGFGQGRSYRDPTDDDSLWPSVTTALKHEDKSALIQWAVDQVAAFAVERTDVIMGDPDKAYNRLRFAHNDVRDIRAELGTGVHATIEAEHKGTWEFPDLNAEQLSMLENWRRFCQDYRVEVLMSEFTVRGRNYMGTADLLIRYTDPLTGDVRVSLVDVKTSKNIWPGHFAQLAALAAGEYVLREVDESTEGASKRKGKVKAEDSWWIRQPMPGFDEVAVLQLREDFYKYEVVENLDLHERLFQCYVSIHEANQDLKERVKK